MNLIKAAAGVLNQTPLDWHGNKRRIVTAIERARAEEVTVLCLPELCITGYGCEDAFHSPGVARTALDVLTEIVPETVGMIVTLGLPLMHRGGLFDTCALVADGRLLGLVGKQYLAGDGLHYEPRWFKRWPDDVRSVVKVGDASVPLGDLLFDVGGVRMGFEICEDAWAAERPGAELARHGVDLIFNPSASHFAFGKHEIRKRFVIEGSRAFSVSYLYANLVGNEAGRAIYDGDAMIASGGKFVAVGPRFTFNDVHLTTATIDIDATRMHRAQLGSYEPVLVDEAEGVVACDFEFPRVATETAAIEPPAWETGEYVKEEEFTRAVSLALFDYMHKSRSWGFVVSLSGGADSSATAVLCRTALQFAWNNQGESVIAEKLAYLGETAETSSLDELVSNLLTCVYQSTRNSGRTTRQAASGLAEGLRADYLEFDVDAIVQSYTSLVSGAIGRELSWETDDIALQNIQARARAPGIWMLANVRGALLLATSNRSEAAVGYTTMDGDTCGGLSPIAGIDKAFLRRWLQWMQAQGPEGVGPLKALELVTAQEPTAELRPADDKQTDEGDLMPYSLLDVVERAAIRDKLTPVEVYRRVSPLFSQYDAEQLVGWIERFFRLWCRNQWKRERYAPSFHLDDENLDPKTWCRFPILSGGFERELEELRKLVLDERSTADNRGS